MPVRRPVAEISELRVADGLFVPHWVGVVNDLAHFRERLPAPVSKFLDPLIN
jgi:hypothetical protein